MMLTVAQAYELLAKHGSYILEVCDKCGAGIDAARYTRRGAIGVYCSPACRGEFEWQANDKPKRQRSARARNGHLAVGQFGG